MWVQEIKNIQCCQCNIEMALDKAQRRKKGFMQPTTKYSREGLVAAHVVISISI